MEKQFKSLISEKFIEELPFWEKIRACWISNQIHCNMNSSSKRETLIKKGINFSGDWTAEKGFFRYYLFHIINNYIPGKSILKRKDKNKGFSPDNCIIVDKPTKSKRGKKSKKELSIVNNNPTKKSPINITNNIFIADNAGELIKALLQNAGVQSIEDKPNKKIIS